MAEQIKDELAVKINNSQIKKIKEPDFSQEIVIDRIHLLPKNVFDQHYEMMKKTFPDVRLLIPNQEDFRNRFEMIKRAIPELNPEQVEHRMYEEEIARRINSLVIRDAVFDRAMKILVPCYEITIDQKDLESFADLLRKVQPGLINAPKDYVELLARRSIEKELIFIVLAKEWNINVTDEDAKKVLMNYYHATNDSVRDKINNQEELDKIKSTLMEQTIANRICSMLKYKLDMDAINKHADEDKARAQEFLKQQEAEAKQEEKK